MCSKKQIAKQVLHAPYKRWYEGQIGTYNYSVIKMYWTKLWMVTLELLSLVCIFDMSLIVFTAVCDLLRQERQFIFFVSLQRWFTNFILPCLSFIFSTFRTFCIDKYYAVDYWHRVTLLCDLLQSRLYRRGYY